MTTEFFSVQGLSSGVLSQLAEKENGTTMKLRYAILSRTTLPVRQFGLLWSNRKQYCSLILVYFVLYIHFLCYDIYGLYYKNIVINNIITNFFIRKNYLFEIKQIRDNFGSEKRSFGKMTIRHSPTDEQRNTHPQVIFTY